MKLKSFLTLVSIAGRTVKPSWVSVPRWRAMLKHYEKHYAENGVTEARGQEATAPDCKTKA